jgi:hypothetical protein
MGETATSRYTMLTQLYLCAHQLERDKTWTLVTLAFIQIDDILRKTSNESRTAQNEIA